jgi:PHS family inorganic phosphate transporter-like MFS transporter
MGFGEQNPENSQDIFNGLMKTCIGNLVLSVAGLIPGYYVTFFLIDSWGRRPIQLMGFTMLTILFATMGRRLVALPQAMNLAKC